MSLFNKKKKKNYSTYVKSQLLDDKSPFIITEAYKSIRTNLMFMLSNKKKVVAFTSSLAGEGKTTTCLNLGIAFAHVGSKVVIIDMDMRKPRTHRYFEIPSAPGVSDFLAGFTKEIPVSKTKYENLFVIPVGTIPPNSPELLMDPTFDELLESLRKDFDYVFIDTPPIHVVTDAAIIASKLDGIVFVVRENTVPIGIVRQSIDSLQRVDAKILGFVMNDSLGDSLMNQYKYRRRHRARYGYSYGYGYGYHLPPEKGV